MIAIERARRVARKIIEDCHYDGICTVIEHRKVTDEKTRITSFQDVIVLKDQPCHLVFKTITAAAQSGSAAGIEQATKLLISPDVAIRPGSKVTVTQAGVTEGYKSSGVPAVYQTHQEIMLELFRGWS